MRKKIIKIFLHIIGVILFVFATAYALLAAYGYQIDLLHQNIVKTSIIDLASELNDAEIFVDNKLVSNKAPYQVKNIKPGVHKIEINKENFTSWNKKVLVSEDVVTKVHDILLLPLDLKSYFFTIKLDFNYDEFLINKDYFIFVSRKENQINIHKLNEKKLEETGRLNLLLADRNIYFIDAYRLAIQDKENVFVVDLRENNTLNIRIPDEFKKFSIAYTPNLTGYYLNDESIFKVEINDDGVFNEITSLKTDENCIYNFEIISSYDHAFIKCDANLFEVISNELNVIDDSIVISPKISHDGVNLVYLNEQGEILKYNIYLKEKE
ncbi:PEGA domain-containing protein, partial [Patescibacteria group bacterium]